MAARYRRLIEYSEFVQRVRRHRPSELLPALAVTANRYFEVEDWRQDRICLPWSLASAAKVSIVEGNEYRASGVTELDVRAVCAAYNALVDPLTRPTDDTTGTVGAFLVRISNEQFQPQQSYFEEISRLGTLFDDLDDLDTEILDSTLLRRLLGHDIGDFINAGFVLAVAARQNAGFFDPTWRALREGPEAIDRSVSIDLTIDVFNRHFLTDFAWVRAQAERFRQGESALRHHEFNPLAARPFVQLQDGRFLAPQPHFIFQRLSPSAVYYSGLEQLGDADAAAFTRDIGVVFQHYIGRQLRVLPDAQVLPEIVYDSARDQRSVDWFVIFDDRVLLVEAKSTRLSHLARMGGTKLSEDITRSVGRAFRQLNRSYELVRSGHPAFKDVPKDRPMLGVVATLEPYWSVNSSFVRDLLPEPQLPVTVASAREIEYFVDMGQVRSGSALLQEIAGDAERSAWNLGNALPDVDTPRNPILDASWARFAIKPPPDSAAT